MGSPFVFITCCLVTFIQVSKNNAQGNFQVLEARCQRETNVPKSDIENYKNFRLPETIEGQCYGACVMKAVNMMDQRGKILPKRTEELAARYIQDGNQLEKIGVRVQRCARIANREKDACSGSYRFSGCLLAGRGATTRESANLSLTFNIPLSFSPPPISLTLFSFG